MCSPSEPVWPSNLQDSCYLMDVSHCFSKIKVELWKFRVVDSVLRDEDKLKC